jgi:hypothetical protein
MRGKTPFCLQYSDVNKWPQRNVQAMIYPIQASPLPILPSRKMSQFPVKDRPDFFTGFRVLIQLALVLAKYLKA